VLKGLGISFGFFHTFGQAAWKKLAFFQADGLIGLNNRLK